MAEATYGVSLRIEDAAAFRADADGLGRAGAAALSGIGDAAVRSGASINGVRESAAAYRAEMREAAEDHRRLLVQFDAARAGGDVKFLRAANDPQSQAVISGQAVADAAALRDAMAGIGQSGDAAAARISGGFASAGDKIAELRDEIDETTAAVKKLAAAQGDGAQADTGTRAGGLAEYYREKREYLDRERADLAAYDAEKKRWAEEDARRMREAAAARKEATPTREQWVDDKEMEKFLVINNAARNPFRDDWAGAEEIAKLKHDIGGLIDLVSGPFVAAFDLVREAGTSAWGLLTDGAETTAAAFDAAAPKAEGVAGALAAINAQKIEQVGQAASDAGDGMNLLRDAADFATLRLAAQGGALGTVGNWLLRLGPVGAAAAAALTAVGAGVAMLGSESAAARQMADIERKIAATGRAAGVGAEEIDAMARALAQISDVEVMAGRAALATAANIGTAPRAALGEILSVARQMEQILGGDLAGNAEMLAHAFENPAAAMEQVNAKARVLSETVRAQIKDLHDQGREAEAGSRLLRELDGALGGASRKMDEQTKGARNLANAWNNIWEAISGGEGGGLKKLLDDGLGLAGGALKKVSLAIGVGTRAELRRELEAAQKDFYAVAANPGGGDDPLLKIYQGKIDRLSAALAALPAETAPAGGGVNSGAADRASGQVVSRQKQVDNEILKSTRSRIDTVKAWEKEEIEWLENRRAEGADKKLTDDAVAAVKRKSALDQKKIREEEGRGGADLRGDIGRRIEALNEERDALALTDRQREISAEVMRAEEQARRAGTALTREEADALAFSAGQLFDGKKAREDHNRAMEEGRRLTEEMRSPREQEAAEIENLNRLLAEGAVSYETYNRAIKKVGDGGDDVGKTMKQMGSSFESAFEKAALGGEKLSKTLSALMADLGKIAMRKGVTGPLFDWFGDIFGSFLKGGGGGGAPILSGTGFYHAGGVAGYEPTFSLPVDSAAFIGAPRFHSGRIPGLMAGEMPAIIRRDEAVLTPGQMAALGPAGGTTNVYNQVVNVTVNRSGGGGDAGADKAMAGEIARQVQASLRGMVSSEIQAQQRPGGLLAGGAFR
jgi:hypothetical protein